jgi:WD40 repeat protein/serine/threonine protein kinase
MQPLKTSVEPISVATEPVESLDPLPPLPGTHKPPATLEFPSAGLPAETGEPTFTLPGYEILGILGRGGMGIVYKARQITLNRFVALKMSRTGEMADEQERERFRAEAWAVAQLRHPNIVQIYEVGEHQGRPFFSFEYVEGGSLADALNGTPQPARVAAQIVETLARAMHVAHQQGIVHRDLKPANILLAGFRMTASGAGNDSAKAPTESEVHAPYSSRGSARYLLPTIPKITDFGVAKRLDTSSMHTATGAVVGTPNYMAPEQAWGRDRSRPIGPTADVYSLGAILYEMLTGRPPFLGETPLDTLQQVVSEDPVAPTRLQPKIPKDLETICLKCLAKEPVRRYPNAHHLAEDLRRFLEDRPIQARPAGTLIRLLRWRRRNPGVAMLLVAIAFVLLLGMTVSAALTVRLAFLAESYHTLSVAADEKAEEANNNAALYKEQKVEAEKFSAMNLDLLTKNEKQKKELEVKSKELEIKSKLLEQRLQEVLTAKNSSYLSLLQLALREMKDENVPFAVYLLDTQLPSKTDGIDLRSFEWYYLRRLCGGQERVLAAHPGPVTAVALSPNGRLLATANADQSADGKPVRVEITLWNTSTGKRVDVVGGHNKTVTALAFSADGSRLASASDDNTVKIWEVGAKIKLLFTCEGHTREITCLQFGPKPDNNDPNGEWLASGSVDKTVRFWKLADGKADGTLPEMPDAVEALAIHPGGKTIAVSCRENDIYFFDIARGREVRKLPTSNRTALRLAYHPTEPWLACTSSDGTVRIWNLADEEKTTPLATLQEHTGTVTGLAFSPDGASFATVSEDKTMRLWDTASKKVVKTFAHGSPFLSLGWGAGGLLVGGGADGKVVLRASQLKGDVQVWTGHTAEVVSVTWSRDGKTVASARGLKFEGQDDPNLGSEVLLWDVATGQPRAKIDKDAKRVQQCRFQPGGSLLATCALEGGVRLWEGSTAAPVRVLGVPNATYNGLAWSPNGNRVAAASEGEQGGKVGSRITVWDVKTGAEMATIFDPNTWVESLAWSADGDWLAAGSSDPGGSEIHVWNVADRSLAFKLPAQARILGLAFSPTGHKLASASLDGTLLVWDLKAGKTPLVLRGHTGGVHCLCFTTDGKRLVSGGEDHLVKVWDASTGQDVLTLRGHQGTVTGVAFRADGFQLASVSQDGTVRVWDATPLPDDVAPPK